MTRAAPEALRHHAYQAAIATRLGKLGAAEEQLEQARRATPSFEIEAFVHSQPYRDAADAERLLSDLTGSEGARGG